MEAYGYGEQDFIPCEMCSKQAVDIHHIIYRSERPNHPLIDHPVNLIGVCRFHHEYFHKKKSNRDGLVQSRKLDEIILR